MKPRNKIPLIGGITLLTLLVACTTTVKPVNVRSKQASFSGTNQNSGIVSHSKLTHTGEVDPHWREQYNGLIEIYGKRFIPPLVQDYGMTPMTNGDWKATDEAFVNKGKMLLWRRNNIK